MLVCLAYRGRGTIAGRGAGGLEREFSVNLIEAPVMWLRVRFTVRSLMIAVAASAVALAYLGTGSTRLGCGSASVVLTFHIVDDLDDRPVAGARLELIRDYSVPPVTSAITGTDGCVQVACSVGATWYTTYRQRFLPTDWNRGSIWVNDRDP
jgi:hypothetical protein